MWVSYLEYNIEPSRSIPGGIINAARSGVEPGIAVERI